MSQRLVVWAIKYGDLHKRVLDLLTQRHQLATDPLSRTQLANLAFDQFGLQPQSRTVVAGEPDEMNERMAAQQGLFLLQFDLTASFEKDLLGTFGVDADFGWGGPTLCGRSTSPRFVNWCSCRT